MRTLRGRRREPCQIGPLAVVAASAAVLLVAIHGTSARAPVAAAGAPAWRGLVGNRPAEVSVGERAIVVLKAPSLAARVAAAGGRASESDERRWNAQALQRQKQLLSRLSLQEGLSINADFTYTRVLNGFAAALAPAAVGALERAAEVAGVYPVRIGYPAAVPSSSRIGRPAPYGSVALPHFDGHGVTIALLDTGVDRAHAYLGGRVRRGFDVVGGGASAAAESSPADPSLLERHGTELAGLLVGRRGPAGAHGVAPGASVLPVRVAGWQQDAHRNWVVYGRTDQVIAGLERAVDPNGDGDTHDGARVTLLGIVEPWAAFPDGPAAQAVRGALALDDLVVTPAGNDGPAGPLYGSISGPGGAAGTLTVGAADLRRQTSDVRVVARNGLRVLLDARLPLAGSGVPRRGLTLPVGMARGGGSAPPLSRFFSRDGRSLVAGRAALVAGGNDPHDAVENAARAGAYAVLLYGDSLPAGALGLDQSVTVPVVGIPGAAAAELAAAFRGDTSVSVSIGAPGSRRNPAAGSIAGFSSRGLAFGGDLKPDLAGSGVALATAEPGVDAAGEPAFGTVNGSSAAAATVAGAAAVLTQARRGIDAPTLKALLVGSSRPLPDAAATAQGAGLVDIGVAAATEVVAEPVSLMFSRPGESRTLRLRSVSMRRLVLGVRGGGGLRVTPRVLTLATHGSATLTVSAPERAGSSGRPLAAGALVVAARGGGAIRVPWVYAPRPPPGDVLQNVVLRRTAPVPSADSPAILEVQAGRVLGRAEVRGFARLDLRLLNARGKDLGVLARLRDGLPGRYDFGLTGRGPAGQTLAHGRYRLRLVAVPTGGGRASIRTIDFPVGKLHASGGQ